MTHIVHRLTLLHRKLDDEIWRELKAESVPHMVYRVGATGPYGVQSGGLPTAQLAQMLQL